VDPATPQTVDLRRERPEAREPDRGILTDFEGGRPTIRGAKQKSKGLKALQATESARCLQVRSGFLSRWAQEVGGRR